MARSAAERLKARAMNQNTFTRTSDGDGLKARKGGGGGGRDGELWNNKGDLLRDLREHSDILLKIVHHLVRGVRFQVPLAVDYQ